MLIQDCVVIKAVDEITRCYNNVRVSVFFDVLHVEHEVCDIVVVDRGRETLLTIEQTEFSALGVDVVV